MNERMCAVRCLVKQTLKYLENFQLSNKKVEANITKGGKPFVGKWKRLEIF